MKTLEQLNRIELSQFTTDLAIMLNRLPDVVFTPDQAMSMAESAVQAALKYAERQTSESRKSNSR